MSGIVFFRTRDLEGMRAFYVDRVGCTLWLDQTDVHIYRHGNLLVGFCDRDTVETEGMITFYYETREEVDAMHARFRAEAKAAPAYNPRYDIYHFFAVDPEGRAVEFQRFEHDVPPV